jgi:hypothetical protein
VTLFRRPSPRLAEELPEEVSVAAVVAPQVAVLQEQAEEE